MSFEDTMVLNAELLSMNSILTQVSLLSRCDRAVWSGSDGVVCKLEWVYGFWDNGVDVSHYQRFKALHGYGYECNGSVVI